MSAEVRDEHLRVAFLGIKALPASAGADRVVEQLLTRLPPDDECTVYLLRDGHARLTPGTNRRYVYVPGLTGKHLRAFSYFLLCAVHCLFRGGYDVVHVHNSDLGLFVPLLRLRRGLRVVGTLHGNPYDRAKWSRAARAYLRLSEWFFVRSCHVLTSVSADKSLSGRPVIHIPNGVPLADATPADLSSSLLVSLGLDRDRYLAFACGRLDRTKGLHHLLKAFGELPTDMRLVAIGDFSHDRRYTAEIERAAGQDPRVVLYRGLLSRDELAGVLRGCAAFVFPSEIEAMSMMLLEALVWSRLVVCSDIPANTAIVGADYPFMFASADARSLELAIAHALTSASSWDPATRVAGILARFSWETIAASYRELYRSRVSSPVGFGGRQGDTSMAC